MARSISEYTKKRNFDITSEPPEDKTSRSKKSKHALRFVIQKHDASHLHYDFRLEMNGTLKSWAVPKGPSLDPKDKRLAVHVEDHPISYATFEGSIPKGQYGGGDVIVWDQGVWQPHGDMNAAYETGKLTFTLVGEKLGGDWALVRTRTRGSGDKEQWLLIKEKDDIARPSGEYDIVQMRPESVITGELLPVDKKNQSASPLTDIPDVFAPQLATLVSEPPPGAWLYEIKYDGYRMLARVKGGKVNFFTRNGNDWTDRLPLQARAIEAMNLRDSWLDGEMVVLNEQGLPNFQSLQNAFDQQKNENIIYFIFDAPYLNGIDLRQRAVEDRRGQLEEMLSRQDQSLVRYSAAFDADHQSIVASACAMSLEGVIGKRVGSPYVSRRSEDWIKLKCRLRQEFVIIGYTDPNGGRTGFGAMLLGVHQAIGSSEILYAGRVGTGFNTARLADLYKKMHALQTDASPLSAQLTAQQRRGVHWVKPKLVCEVEFAEWTGEGILRQASFISLRTDKPAKDIIRERPRTLEQPDQAAPNGKRTTPLAKSAAPSDKKSTKHSTDKSSSPNQSASVKNGKVSLAGVNVSHPERVVDPDTGGTKLDLAQYYESVFDFIAPQLKDRPVSLLRAPDGIGGEQFFQKHAENRAIPHVTQLDPGFDPGHGALMAIDTAGALLGCVQMNAIEFHTWGATTANIELPDRFVLDLDPDPALPWRSMIEAVRLTLAVLDELKLNALLKTTGGKGMHIIVPLTPDADWVSVKAFSKAIAEFMAKQIPDRFVAKMGPKNRIGKIFIDYLRNSRGASTVCAYSVRARAGLPVSVPISRDELARVSHSDQWNITNLHERLESLKEDPWKNYSGGKPRKQQKITKAMWKKLGAEAP